MVLVRGKSPFLGGKCKSPLPQKTLKIDCFRMLDYPARAAVQIFLVIVCRLFCSSKLPSVGISRCQ
jgi:hypothetical protein